MFLLVSPGVSMKTVRNFKLWGINGIYILNIVKIIRLQELHFKFKDTHIPFDSIMTFDAGFLNCRTKTCTLRKPVCWYAGQVTGWGRVTARSESEELWVAHQVNMFHTCTWS